jgi:hypothetical protein
MSIIAAGAGTTIGWVGLRTLSCFKRAESAQLRRPQSLHSATVQVPEKKKAPCPRRSRDRGLFLARASLSGSVGGLNDPACSFNEHLHTRHDRFSGAFSVFLPNNAVRYSVRYSRTRTMHTERTIADPLRLAAVYQAGYGDLIRVWKTARRMRHTSRRCLRSNWQHDCSGRST